MMMHSGKTPAPAQLEKDLRDALKVLKAWNVQKSGLFGIPELRPEEALVWIETGSRAIAQLRELGLLKNGLDKLADQFYQIVRVDHSDASTGSNEPST